MRNYATVLTILSMLLAWNSQVSAAQSGFDHGAWQQLLQRHVRLIEGGNASQVDYAGMGADRVLLDSYLQSLSAVSEREFSAWPEAERLAFLINAYNAWTVELILTEYPNLESIKDLGSLFRSPWSRRFVPLFGNEVSLDYIEHDLIRGSQGYGEPRIHFAVNCASIGCPALRREAFSGARLEQQLEEATRLFLADRSRNRLDGNTLRVSEIFDWYEEDFEQGWRGVNSVGQFLVQYREALDLPDAVVEQLQRDDFRIRYLNYDWRLNSLAD
jgi:hypothetical protein